VPTHKRSELIDKFADDDSIQVFIFTDAGGVGLNLQMATVLINMDMPWNPAVLDQRIVRIHRLGQKHPVQIFLLLAEDSYEQRVASLVKGKRDWFDNVVNPEAAEDVVGVSKKMLETLIDDLAKSSRAVKDDVTELPTETVEAISLVVDEQTTPGTVKQTAFTPRIQRIMGANGGLPVVLEQCT
jgi:superfamily II DNA/RNA helicase